MINQKNENEIKSPIALSFSKYARGYDRHAHLQKVMAEKLAAFLPNEMPKHVLEIGSGTGLIYILRWFWWRINAYTEIVAMASSLFIALYFNFINTGIKTPGDTAPSTNPIVIAIQRF